VDRDVDEPGLVDDRFDGDQVPDDLFRSPLPGERRLARGIPGGRVDDIGKRGKPPEELRPGTSSGTFRDRLRGGRHAAARSWASFA
jgi:hypothetical protein